MEKVRKFLEGLYKYMRHGGRQSKKSRGENRNDGKRWLDCRSQETSICISIKDLCIRVTSAFFHERIEMFIKTN